jgi:outer membrane protein OmpA-like peptidoglycan-associated protein
VNWLLLLAAAAALQQESPAQLRFVACPIYRDVDAGRKSGCWLVDAPASGIRYDVSAAPSKPDWDHAVLVEGISVPAAADACGGVQLDPVRTSILPETCPRHMLPAEGFRGRPFVLPPRNVAPLSAPRPVPPGPYATRRFSLVFDFDKAFVVYQLDDYLLDQAITWIRAAAPARIVVTGHAVTRPALVSGHQLAERRGLARERAERIAEALVRLGVPRGRIETRWRDNGPPAAADGADGLIEPSRRRVDIDAIMAPQ